MDSTKLKDMADDVLERSSLYSIDPQVLKFFLDTGMYRENAEKRLIAILDESKTTDDSDFAPDILLFKVAVLIVTEVLEEADQTKLMRNKSERWLFG